MKKLILALAFLTSCSSHRTIPEFEDKPVFAINTMGFGTIHFKNGNIDRGHNVESPYKGAFRYYQESWANVLYLYNGDQLISRINNPEDVEIQ